jgi:hypothetical protein
VDETATRECSEQLPTAVSNAVAAKCEGFGSNGMVALPVVDFLKVPKKPPA